MSATGDALEALFAAIKTKSEQLGSVLPAPLQNEALPSRLATTPSDGLDKHLNIWDAAQGGGDGETDEFLGAEQIADGFDLTWRAPIEFIVAGGTREQRRAAFEAGLDEIWDAIAADRTLAGTVDHAEMPTPRRTGAGLVTDGMPNILAAEIMIVLQFTSSKSF